MRSTGKPATPYAGLVLGKNGNLYGTTVNGGLDGYGTVFELEPSGEFRVIYQFSGVNDFSYPQVDSSKPLPERSTKNIEGALTLQARNDL